MSETPAPAPFGAAAQREKARASFAAGDQLRIRRTINGYVVTSYPAGYDPGMIPSDEKVAESATVLAEIVSDWANREAS